MGLADRVGEEAGVERGRFEPFDVYLGRVEASGYPVHARVAELIEASPSPNILHDAVIGLFPAARDLRIVTTNFDPLLTVAAASRFSEPPHEYVAPALPFGGDMRGIVYLHGRVGDRPEDLVVTDTDFGRAYLTRGHATRFLLDLYAQNAVLFVGYSHSDTVLTYLARGLPPGLGKRYALSAKQDRERWLSPSVEPLEVPSRKGLQRHRALARGLAAWVRIAAWVHRPPNASRRACAAWAEPRPRSDGLSPGENRRPRHRSILLRRGDGPGMAPVAG